MGLNAIFLNSLSGLAASQTGLSATSKNIANANTEGYARVEPKFSALTVGGVEVQALERAADRFLAAAQRRANTTQQEASARADLLDRAQAAFGDPNGGTTVFDSLDQLFNAFEAAAIDPSSPINRNAVLGAVQDLYDQFSYLGGQIESLRVDADNRIGESVYRANELLQQISFLNNEVVSNRLADLDATGVENERDALLDELSGIFDINVQATEHGGVEVRTNAGTLLVGKTVATLSYEPQLAPYGTPGSVLLNKGEPNERAFEGDIRGGALAGLITARDVDLTDISAAVGELAASTADALNAAHAQNSTYPAATVLKGRNTGLIGSDALNFTGQTTIGVVNGAGDLLRRIAVDFGAGTITVDSTVTNFADTVDDFVAALNGALAGVGGAATFTDGALSLSGGGGLVVQDPTAGGSDRAGRSFSHFFGLNDLITGAKPACFETGLSGTDAHGLATAGAITFRIADARGKVLAEPSVAVVGTTWDDIVAALNDQATGFGRYARAALSAEGKLQVTPLQGVRVDVVDDSTARGTTGLSATALFGIDRAASAGRATALGVDAAISNAPEKVALARPSLDVALGQRVVEGGDGKGASALLAVKDTQRKFSAAGGIAQQATTLALYASRVGSYAASLSAQAERARASSQSLLDSATERRARVEGVNLDDELVKMTQHQQSYAASARVLQAASDMLDTLLNIR
jgi:flagellar hook-associated protein 1 FlgK